MFKNRTSLIGVLKSKAMACNGGHNVYNHTDHLGNIRQNITRENGRLTVLREHNYYPFGLLHRGYNEDKEDLKYDKEQDFIFTVQAQAGRYKYKFQGQERQEDLNLGWDSFKYRNYDYAIGRFFNVDPLAEKFPYNGVYNFSENRVVDGVELEGLEYARLDDLGINPESAQNEDGTWTFDLGDTHFENVQSFDINGETYIDLGQHMYYGENGWSTNGTRQEQITFESKVGIQLVSNIENLPQAPDGYTAPPMWDNPEQSWAVANQYQDCGGMCFAVSMARVHQAFADQGESNAINLSTLSVDYRISGTILNNIPNQYAGYGVGGALANNGYGYLVNNTGVWNGELQRGAVLQYWWYGSFNAAQADNFSMGGHSIIFENYIYDSNGTIIGLNYADYQGTGRTLMNTPGRIIVGANLIDP